MHYVVIDKSTFTSLPRTYIFPPSVTIVLLDCLVAEIIENAATDRSLKLWHFIRSHPERVVFGHGPYQLMAMERSATKRLSADAFIDHWGTSLIESVRTASADNFLRKVEKLRTSTIVSSRVATRDSFVEACSEIRHRINDGDPYWKNWLSRSISDEEVKRWYQDPNTVADILKTHPRLGSPSWQHALRFFPDRTAAGRWHRLLIFQFIEQYSISQSQVSIEHNWEDMQYVFTATYAANLLTSDKRMTLMSSTFFPYVRVDASPDSLLL
jgi:hypothetical protein